MTDLVSTTTRSHRALDAPSPSGLALKCRYESCPERFNTHEEITKHMYEDLAHPFCGRCKKQFEDKSAYYDHKISSPLHFMCPICLTDFQSKTGRDYHMRRSHPPEQQLTCQGCEEVFPSGGSMMQHIEAGGCPGISLTRLVMEQSRRHNAHSILETAPKGPSHRQTSEWTKPVEEKAPLPAIEMSGAVKTSPPMRLAPIESMKFSSKIVSARYTEPKSPLPTRAFTPPVQQASPVKEEVSTINLLMSDTEDTTLLKWPALSPTISPEPIQDLILFGESESSPEREDKSAKAVKNISPKDTLLDSNQNLTQTPIQNGNPTQNQDYPFLTLLEKSANLHKDFIPAKVDPEEYHNPPQKTYNCVCGYHTKSHGSFSSHVAEERRWANKGLTDAVCPQCNKVFASTSALVGHLETARGRCSIRSRKVFGRAIDDATGGILGVAGEQAGAPVLLTRPLEGMNVSAAPLGMRVKEAGRAEDRAKGFALGYLVKRDLQGEEVQARAQIS